MAVPTARPAAATLRPLSEKLKKKVFEFCNLNFVKNLNLRKLYQAKFLRSTEKTKKKEIFEISS